MCLLSSFEFFGPIEFFHNFLSTFLENFDQELSPDVLECGKALLNQKLERFKVFFGSFFRCFFDGSVLFQVEAEVPRIRARFLGTSAHPERMVTMMKRTNYQP